VWPVRAASAFEEGLAAVGKNILFLSFVSFYERFWRHADGEGESREVTLVQRVGICRVTGAKSSSMNDSAIPEDQITSFSFDKLCLALELVRFL
jgi:hypothetical protein